MASRNQPIRTRSFISIDGAEPVEFCTLSPEERERALEKMMDNTSRVLSRWISTRPEVAERMKQLCISVEEG